MLRGGGWYDPARFARSACRFADPPVNANVSIGFRLARGQRGARPADLLSIRQAERRSLTDQPPVQILKRIGQSQTLNDLRVGQAPAIISSDRERIFIDALEKPDWAHTIGRDVYGLFVDVTIAGIDQRMRWINPGRFMMGSPESEAGRYRDEWQHEVQISRGFWLAETTCTQSLWFEVMGHNPSKFDGEQRPVDSVSWLDVVEFIAQVNTQNEGLNLCLPTEAQWEYGCRAGTLTPFSFGDQMSTEQANFNGSESDDNNPIGEYRQSTINVKALSCNHWGLYQMHGNVWEWCLDWSGEYPRQSQSVDPSGPSEGDRRVLRGGSWNGPARFARSAYRLADPPDDASLNIGFRLARGQVSQDSERFGVDSDQTGASDVAEPRRTGLGERLRRIFRRNNS